MFIVMFPISQHRACPKEDLRFGLLSVGQMEQLKGAGHLFLDVIFFLIKRSNDCSVNKFINSTNIRGEPISCQAGPLGPQW